VIIASARDDLQLLTQVKAVESGANQTR